MTDHAARRMLAQDWIGGVVILAGLGVVVWCVIQITNKNTYNNREKR